ncbi:fatty acyl-CoA synthetase [Falsigemmobacter faecalis]|uniref:3-methylmercaptopropionyl-CoA ligase n=1 Tax=Falsigemmobacter faecalis TaxID=2488730 RepID=A0A3P3DVD6_9RHOB|nr:fatty acyl-CoA synthetase [Falsigemmobacter faecalis]RRH78247.1 acyl-CoA synthetase [Falsigemmobacter faecalis]
MTTTETAGQSTGRNTIQDALSRAARRFGAATALSYEDRNWSFAGLYQSAGRIALSLQQAGLKKGDRVAAYGTNSDAFFLLWLACVRGGFVHVPINYGLVGRELEYILANSGASALYWDAALADKAKAVSPALPQLSVTGLLSDLLPLALAGTPVPGDLCPDLCDEDLAQLLYTSGTTAAPKGAMMTHRALLAEYTSSIIELDFSREDRALAALPLYHSAQMHVFVMPQLLMGAHSRLIATPQPETCLQLIEAEQITSFFAPPTVWISLLRSADFDRRDLSSLKFVYYGASIMPVPVLQELRARLPNARPYNCYGQSEIGPLATVLRPEEHDARPASAGKPIFNVETRLVDEQMQDVPPGTQGEIVHRSPQLLTGYWAAPEATAEAFHGGWFHSGDVGIMDEDGYLTVVDRVKDIIKTGGTIVASREVEEVIFTHPSVKEVAVVGLPHPKWIEAVVAFVVLRPGETPDSAAILTHAKSGLAPFKLPKAVIWLEDLPRNTAGKILKRELRRTYEAEFAQA